MGKPSISWDDYHEEFVSFENVRRAVVYSRKIGIEVAISITQDLSAHWNAQRVRDELGEISDGLAGVCDSPLNKTGRAESQLAEKEKLKTSHLGPCPYVLTGPTLSARGKLLACCGVVPEISHLVIDEHFSPNRLNASLEKAQKSVLLNWLYVFGPFHLMKTIAKENGLSLPQEDSFGGNCEACQKVLTDPIYKKLIPATLEASSHMVSDYVHVLGALDSLQHGGPMKFMPG
jgi:hypothetical protein